MIELTWVPEALRGLLLYMLAASDASGQPHRGVPAALLVADQLRVAKR